MTAGGSAQREFERRKAKERAAIKRALVWTVPLVIVLSVAGVLLVDRFVGSFGWTAGVLIAATLGMELWGTSPHITAYGIGAEGERLTGRVLDKLDGYVVLHDRKIPGSAANIDHVAIGPGGVFVVGSKNYKGEVTVKGDDLFVAGRQRTPIVEQTWREAVNVQTVLAEHMTRLAIDDVPVLCVHGSGGSVEDGSGGATGGAAGAQEVDDEGEAGAVGRRGAGAGLGGGAGAGNCAHGSSGG